MRSPTPDPVDLLAAHAPTHADIERHFPPEAQAVVLGTVLGQHSDIVRSEPPRRRRRARVAAGVAAATALIITAQALLPDAAPHADALDLIADTAAAAPASTIPEGSFQHMVRVDDGGGTLCEATAGGQPEAADAGAEPSCRRVDGDSVTHESWTAADGTVWRADTTTGGSEYWVLPPPGDGFSASSPAAVAALPSDPAELEAYLRAHRIGSSSANEAVFVAIGDLLSMGYVPSPVRRAALQVLAGLPEVSTASDITRDGRAALRVDFSDPAIRGDLVFSLWFDETSAAVIESSQRDSDGWEYVSLVTQGPSVVSAVPDEVLAHAVDAYAELPPGYSAP